MRISLLKVAFDQTVIGAVASPVVGAVLCAALWSAVDHSKLINWFVVLMVAMVARYAARSVFERRQGLSVKALEWVFAVSLIVSSLAWGVGGLYILPDHSPFHDAIVFSFLVGMGSGAALSYSAQKAVAIFSLCSIVTPVTVVFLFKQQIEYYSLAVSGVLLMAIASGAVLRIGGFIRQSFLLTQQIEKQREEAERRARTDHLTGLNNRGAFYEMGQYLIAQTHRMQHPISMMLIDLDFFKQINDSYGHACGDKVLRRVADILKQSSRDLDVLGRLGGDEFGVLLPGTAEQESLAYANRVRELVHDSPRQMENFNGNMSCSIGVAQYEAGESLEELLSRADQALYRSKHLGRDQVSASAGHAQADSS